MHAAFPVLAPPPEQRQHFVPGDPAHDEIPTLAAVLAALPPSFPLIVEFKQGDRGIIPKVSQMHKHPCFGYL